MWQKLRVWVTNLVAADTGCLSPVATRRDEDKVTWMRKLPGTQIHKIQSGCDQKRELIDFLLVVNTSVVVKIPDSKSKYLRGKGL